MVGKGKLRRRLNRFGVIFNRLRIVAGLFVTVAEIYILETILAFLNDLHCGFSVFQSGGRIVLLRVEFATLFVSEFIVGINFYRFVVIGEDFFFFAQRFITDPAIDIIKSYRFVNEILRSLRVCSTSKSSSLTSSFIAAILICKASMSCFIF